MMKRLMALLVAMIFAVASLAAPAAAQVSDEEAAKAKAEIIAVVTAMEKAWNSGDFKGYMAGFENPGVRFVSGGRIKGGWQDALDNYVNNYGASPHGRGELHFYDITVEVYSPDAALLISRYHLERAERPQEGVNTRLFRKIDGRWVINMNHVSSFEAHAGEPGTEGVPAR
ncbi:YybH family protein [Gimibacter soli]|uniref:Nuclear transport factor 2 family protein n=1 Tax=Gimibacter soli TaxID=3024400 RepID=A0AAF0BM83_9PROT|nr:nuclear transport factor 2 family protein [Gimibacter soli]WCL55187.1 nuclear transport factor 2 family protein [Gimibacter soli]